MDNGKELQFINEETDLSVYCYYYLLLIIIKIVQKTYEHNDKRKLN